MEPTGPGVRAVENETSGTVIRTTKDGRKMSYQLTVLQQPSRARACGAGAKSSTDRRPVDPPPIVELKVFEEGENETTPQDITFRMNANYFLFATLEQARIIAPGRGMADSQNQLTVLTGTPVAGMVLLERPNPAGYFIFADLSVRHEGKYRLAFSLYEELKNPQDEDLAEDVKVNGPHVTHRLEVKSMPFTVYSAKKFPGLTESTSLSRIVAEQGCRVRIRRDVRMRRRDQKPGKDWDGYEEETAEARARMSATPEGSAYQGIPPPHHYMDPISRPRSSSTTSHHSLAPSLSLPRRPSLQDMNYSQHGYGTAPHTPQSAYPQPSPYGPSPTHNYGSTTFAHQQSMQPPPPQYQQPSYQQPPLLPHPASSQSHNYPYGSSTTPTQPQVAPGAPAYEGQERHRSSADQSMSMSSDSRRPSIAFGPPPPLPQAPAYGSKYSYSSEINSQSGYQTQSQASFSSHHNHQPSYGSSDLFTSRPPPAAPLEPIQPRTGPSFTTPPLSDRPFSSGRLPPINTSLTTMSNKPLEPAPPSPAGQQSSYYSAVHTPNESHKRGYGQVFNDRHFEPLKQAARPSTPGHSYAHYYGGAEVEDNGYEQKLYYKRSAGHYEDRQMPEQHHYA